RVSPVAWRVLATVLSLPPRRGKGAASVRFRRPILPSPCGCGLGPRFHSFSRPNSRSLLLRPGGSWSPPRKTLSIGFRVSVSLHPAIQTTGLLTLAPAGLSPAEHTSLRWTHNRTCRFPASGFPAGFTARHATGPLGAGVGGTERRVLDECHQMDTGDCPPLPP